MGVPGDSSEELGSEAAVSASTSLKKFDEKIFSECLRSLFRELNRSAASSELVSEAKSKLIELLVNPAIVCILNGNSRQLIAELLLSRPERKP